MKFACALALSLAFAVSISSTLVSAQPKAGAGAKTAVTTKAAASTGAMSFEQLLSQGQRAKQEGHLQKAQEMMAAALAMAEAKKDPVSIILATNGMAGVYRWQGKFKEAMAMYEKVQKLMVEAKQDKSSAMATVLDNEATVLDDMNDFERAAAVRKDAIRIYEQNGPSRDLAMVYANQSANLHALRHEEDAEIAAQKAVEMYKSVGLSDSPDMAVALDTLGGIYKVQKKYAEAEKVQRQALAMLEKGFGASSPDVAITLSNLSHTLGMEDKWDEAKKLMERSLNIHKQVYGPTAQKTKDAQRQYDELLQAMKSSGK